MSKNSTTSLDEEKDAGEHKEAMKQRQAEHRKRQRELRDPDRGLVLIHTGPGKGKSSSAFGVIVRALGWDQRVGVVQFIKGKWQTGERKFFQKLEDTVDWFTMGDGFTWDTQSKEADTQAARLAFDRAKAMLSGGVYDLVVLDEINIALRYGYLTVDEVITGLEQRDPKTGVILTGRDAPEALCNYADMVSEIQERKHPYKAGIRAQRGIDY
ncbi:MAG: cob(I)yrinic acid a,c-diamide adenosyltransferase [Pseudomonadota bacterium]